MCVLFIFGSHSTGRSCPFILCLPTIESYTTFQPELLFAAAAKCWQKAQVRNMLLCAQICIHCNITYTIRSQAGVCTLLWIHLQAHSLPLLFMA